MADELYLIQGSTLTEIADAIRSKTGSSNEYPVFDFANAISNIQSSSGSDSSGVSNIKTGSMDVPSTTQSIAFNCSFKPTMIVLWTNISDGSTWTDEIVTAYIYNSSDATGEICQYYLYDEDTSTMIVQTMGDEELSSDNPRTWITCYSNQVIVTINNTVGNKFLKGTWYYIAIA